MKQLALIIALLSLAPSVSAQDVIFLCDLSQVQQTNNGNLRCNEPLTTLAVSDLTSQTETDISALVAILEAMFETPDATSIVQGFMAGFTLPFICYLSAWALGIVVNFFRDDHSLELD